MGSEYDQVNTGDSPVEQQYASDEDDDDMLQRYGSHVLNSQSSSGHSSGQNGSSHSASNGISGDEEEGAVRASAHHVSNGNDLAQTRKKMPHARIKDTIEGMRRADKDAQRLRSTRRFLAMSEGHRTPQTFTQTICLSPWCDFSHGRGMALMLGSLSLCVLVAVTLVYSGHLGWGLGTSISGLGIILVRRFWVPLYWLVWGQFAERRRKRNIQRYDTLNGDHPGGLAMPELNNTSGQNVDGSEMNDIGDDAAEDMSFALPPPPQLI